MQYIYNVIYFGQATEHVLQYFLTLQEDVTFDRSVMVEFE